MPNVLDWTVAALKKKAGEAAQANNLALAKLLDNCAEMYIDGLILLTWEGGDPYVTLTDEGISQIDKVNNLMGTEFQPEEFIADDENTIVFEEWEDD